MRSDFGNGALLALLLLASCLLPTECKGGRGGGGSRGSSSRGSSSSSRNRGSTDYNRRNRPSNPPAPPRYQPPPKPSAPEAPVVRQQPAYNPNYRDSNPNVGSPSQPAANPHLNQPAKPPPYQPQERPPPYAPGGPPPAYNPPAGSYPRQPGAAPPAYPGQSGAAPAGAPPAYPGGSYPRQPGAAPPYPVQPGGAAPYPVQPGSSYPRQPGAAPYPVQPGASYPRQPGGVQYPRQGMASQQLGSNVWTPNAGRPAPSFMQSGGLPTGTNMHSKPYKQKGFLGTLFSMGGKSGSMKKSKYYGSHPNPYGMASMGKHGRSAGMYAMLPYMAARGSGGMFKPRFRMPMFIPIMMPHYGGYGYGGYGGYGYGGYGHRHHYYDVNNDNYGGRCNRPLTPAQGKIHCVSTENQVNCEATCLEGFRFPDNETRKENKCWHVAGVFRPTRNFPACKPVCSEICHNNGTCVGPGLCGCPPEYRGNLCQYHFLKCDMRQLAGPNMGWACSHNKNETVCKVSCKAPYQFANATALAPGATEQEMRCAPNGTWSPSVAPNCTTEREKSCSERADVGPCTSYVFPQWYFDSESGTCKTFVYGGCQGNGNRYASGEECMRHCKGEIKNTDSTSIK